MKRFYFTFGTDPKFPYHGGWVEVLAPNMKDAVNAFKTHFPTLDDSNVLNCADYYTEGDFIRYGFLQEGNFGERCHAVIINDTHWQAFINLGGDIHG